MTSEICGFARALGGKTESLLRYQSPGLIPCGCESRIYITHFVWKAFQLINKCKIRFLAGDTPGALGRKNNPCIQTIRDSHKYNILSTIRTPSELHDTHQHLFHHEWVSRQTKQQHSSTNKLR